MQQLKLNVNDLVVLEKLIRESVTENLSPSAMTDLANSIIKLRERIEHEDRNNYVQEGGE
jgi:uncharacterized protein YfkK (UPF0435 family)